MECLVSMQRQQVRSHGGGAVSTAAAQLRTAEPQTHSARGETIQPELEYLFRRCSPKEALVTVTNQRLADGHVLIGKGNGRNSSDRDKWVSRNPRFILRRYQPRDADSEMYREVLVIEVEPGTLRSLEGMKGKEVKKGPKGAYGLPPAAVEWFNKRVVSISAHENGTTGKPKLLPLKSSFEILVNHEGDPCFFIAFPHNLLVFDNDQTGVFFGNDVKLDRTMWLKTSLMWATWRSDFATKEGMQRLLQIAMPVTYLDYLVNSAVSTCESSGQDDIVYQRDPTECQSIGMTRTMCFHSSSRKLVPLCTLV